MRDTFSWGDSVFVRSMKLSGPQLDLDRLFLTRFEP